MDDLQLRLQIKRLRYLLIALTILYIIPIILIISLTIISPPLALFFFILILNKLNILVLLYLIPQFIFCWFIWKKYPDTKSSKRDSILMILFLGIIGMWLWLPSERELYKKLEYL